MCILLFLLLLVLQRASVLFTQLPVLLLSSTRCSCTFTVTSPGCTVTLDGSNSSKCIQPLKYWIFFLWKSCFSTHISRHFNRIHHVCFGATILGNFGAANSCKIVVSLRNIYTCLCVNLYIANMADNIWRLFIPLHTIICNKRDNRFHLSMLKVWQHWCVCRAIFVPWISHDLAGSRNGCQQTHTQTLMYTSMFVCRIGL